MAHAGAAPSRRQATRRHIADKWLEPDPSSACASRHAGPNVWATPNPAAQHSAEQRQVRPQGQEMTCPILLTTRQGASGEFPCSDGPIRPKRANGEARNAGCGPEDGCRERAENQRPEAMQTRWEPRVVKTDNRCAFSCAIRPGLQTQTLAALGTTSVDDLTATAGLHANQKTVGAGTTDLGRLISAFHFWILKAEPAIRSNFRQPVNEYPKYAGYTRLVIDRMLAKNLWITSTAGAFQGLESRPHFKTCPQP